MRTGRGADTDTGMMVQARVSAVCGREVTATHALPSFRSGPLPASASKLPFTTANAHLDVFAFEVGCRVIDPRQLCLSVDAVMGNVFSHGE